MAALVSRKCFLIVVLLFAFTSVQSDDCDESNEDESITFGEGDYKLIPCACSDSAIHWHKVGAKLVLQETVANGVSTLNFPYVTLDDAGAYVCKKEDNSNTTIKTVVVVVTPRECPDFSTPDKKVLEKFRDSQHFNDTRKGLKYGECLQKAVSSLIAKQNRIKDLETNLSNIQTELGRVNGNLTKVKDKLKDLQNNETPIQTVSATVSMTVDGPEIPVEGELHVSCTMASTVAQKKVRYSWRWTEWRYINSTEDPNMNEFDWSVVLRNGRDGIIITDQYDDSNSTCEGSNLTISAAVVERSGRFFCVAEVPHGVRSVSHEVGYSDIRVVNPINDLRLIRNGKPSNQTVPIEIPHGTELEVNCTATGEWAPPDTVNIKAHIDSKVVISGNESDTVSNAKTTTAMLIIPWEKIKGKDVEVLCEAIGDHKSNRSISATVEVSNPIQSLYLIRNGNRSNQTVPIVIPHGSPLEVNCTATGKYAAPDTVNINVYMDSKVVTFEIESSSDTRATTAKLTIPWEKIKGKAVNVSCEAKGERYSNPNITSSIVKVSKAPLGGPVPTDTTTNNTTSESWGSFGTPTVFGGIATVLVVVVVIGVVVVAYRSRDKLRTWIMEKDVSKAALRKAKYARAKGGKGWIKYAKLPRDISEAMSHNE